MSIAALLASARTIAVVGLSDSRFRVSYGVSEYMQAQGYRIIPVNPNITEVCGISSCAVYERGLFRQASDVPVGLEDHRHQVLVVRGGDAPGELAVFPDGHGTRREP